MLKGYLLVFKRCGAKRGFRVLRILSCYLFASLFIPTTAFANIGQLKQLVDESKFNDAYEYALTLLDDYEGDPAFDFQYGVAAIDSGRVSEGVFALERVLLLEPNHALAKLELARGYFKLGHLEKSRRLFNEVQRLNPPSAVQNRIAKYLAAIDQKTTVQPTRITSFIELFSGYDSNINSGPDTQATLVTLSDSALGRSDPFLQLRASLDVDHAYNPEDSFNFGLTADTRFYDTESEQDYRNLGFSGGHTWNRGRNQYLLHVNAQKYTLDGDDYRDLRGVNFGWNTQVARNTVLKTFLGWNELTYETATWKDSDQITLGTNLLYGGSGEWNPIYFAGLFVGDESPETPGILADAEVDRLFYGGNVGVQLSPSNVLTITPALTYQASDYRGVDWLYNVKRKDDFYLMNLNATWTLSKAWLLIANYSYTDVSSNIELYNYDRQQFMLGVRYNFQ